MTITIKNKLAAIDNTKKKGRKKYEICSKDERIKFNNKLSNINSDNFKESILKAAEDTIPTKETTFRKDDMSVESLKLIEIRGAQAKESQLSEANATTKLLNAYRKKDKKEA